MKKNSRPKFIFIIALLIIFSVLMVQHFHIRDFNIVQPQVLYISGQPKGMDYTRLLYKYHIGTIVNVRPASEHRDQNWYAEEIGWVKQNGINYIELPIDKNDYLPNQEAPKSGSAAVSVVLAFSSRRSSCGPGTARHRPRAPRPRSGTALR